MFNDFMFSGMWIGWLLWLVVNQVNKNVHNTQSTCKESAMDVLEKRYTKGEITKEQFEQRKKNLS